MSAEAAMMLEESLMAGRDIRPFGPPVHEHGRPAGLLGILRSRAEVDPERPLTLELQSSGWRAFAPLPVAVVLRRSGDLSEAKRTRSHLELGR